MRRRLGHGGCSFLAFSDSVESAAVAEDCLAAAPSRRLFHPSGRPFVVGTWSDDALRVGRHHDRVLLLFGTTNASDSDLIRFLERGPSLHDTDSFRPAGSYHLLASFGGDILIRGPLSELRRVFYADHRSGTIASSDADTLADLIEAPVSSTTLALTLLTPFAPYPADGESAWEGVTPLRGDLALCVASDGRALLRRHWSPPDPTRSVAEVGSSVRAALEDAVAARMTTSALSSCDLSGGLDSTPLFHLAAAHSADVQAFTTGSVATYQTEMEWAARAVGDKTLNPRISLPAAHLPTPFMAIDTSLGRADGVYVGEPIKMRWASIARFLHGAGSERHLTGHGGDELFTGGLASLRDAFRSNPSRVLSLARGQSALRRQRLSPMVRWMIGRESYATWARRAALHLTIPGAAVGWCNPAIAAPPWMTELGVEQARRALVIHAGSAQPLARHAGQHETIEMVRNAGRITRYDSMLMTQFGVQMEAPYFDDGLMSTALALEPVASLDPWVYKPALKAAVAGIIPEEIRSRSTKTESTEDIWRGLRDHRPSVDALASSMRLGSLGIVDEAAFRRVVLGPQPPSLAPLAVWKTLACEGWLRDLTEDRPLVADLREGS